MVSLTAPAPALAERGLSCYACNEPLFEDLPVYIFYGNSTTANSTGNSSRIQAHIYSLAGYHSFSRLTVAPTSPTYAAVHHLNVELQGDEIYRGLAIALLSYFAATPNGTKDSLRRLADTHFPHSKAPTMFDEMHAGILASRMSQIHDASALQEAIPLALAERRLSWIDIDLILPNANAAHPSGASIEDPGQTKASSASESRYCSLIDSLGPSMFMPTSKLERAPSKSKGHNGKRILCKNEKIALRQELCEFLDTENSYVSKLQVLYASIVPVLGPLLDGKIAETLFPVSLNDIREVNSSFAKAMGDVIEASESDAIADIENGDDNGVEDQHLDKTGLMQFSQTLRTWLLRMRGPYSDYLNTSASLPLVLSDAIKTASSDFTRELAHHGEQQLRSILIEPIQRLPRYSLLIDNIQDLLPTAHPALPALLKSRDMINEICALRGEANKIGRASKVLGRLVARWPVQLNSLGRLITAIDVQLMTAPYTPRSVRKSGIALLFPGNLLLLQRNHAEALSARGLTAEINAPTSTLFPAAETLEQGASLTFDICYDLSALRFSESSSGELIYLSDPQMNPLLDHEVTKLSTKCLELQAPYYGKASRIGEELAKARIEARYPEYVRCQSDWTLHAVPPSEHGIGIVIAVSEESKARSLQDQFRLGSVRVLVDCSQTASEIIADSVGTQIAVCINTSGALPLLELESQEGIRSSDQCPMEQMILLLQRRLAELIALLQRSDDDARAAQRISFDSMILQSLPIPTPSHDSYHRSLRPKSPIKLLSSILGSPATAPVYSLASRPKLSEIDDIPKLSTPMSVYSNDTALIEKATTERSNLALVQTADESTQSTLVLLEATFEAYIVALRSRSGNIVGKTLQGRSSADELLVNELYNVLLEEPGRLDAAALVSVDVLFAAFEKFLQRAWKDRVGCLVSPTAIQEMQAKFYATQPNAFAQYFKQCLDNMSPQNRRSFGSTIELLADLLEASGNDGDRGVLTASFAEVLIPNQNPHDYIILLDRLVDDYENLFDEESTASRVNIAPSATNSLGRNRSLKAASVNSNTSSLRRKLGLGSASTRDANAGDAADTKVMSIWRTLSKASRSPGDSNQSNSKMPLSRSLSTDTDHRLQTQSRPTSSGRPMTANSNLSSDAQSRPGSSHQNKSMQAALMDDEATRPIRRPRKARRSSLSDVQLPTSFQYNDLITPLSARGAEPSRPLPLTPTARTPAKHSLTEDNPTASGSRVDEPVPRATSPSKIPVTAKENSPAVHTGSSAKPIGRMKQGTVAIPGNAHHRSDSSKTNIPTPRTGLSERAWPPNATVSPVKTTPSTSPTKMRVQSPQKLRQRLSQEQNPLASNNRPHSTKSVLPHQATSSSRRPTTSDSTGSVTDSTQNRQANTQSQSTPHALAVIALENRLVITTNKLHALDDLYTEANAENEALYDRFNDELGKILARVRRGDGVEELRAQMSHAVKEAAALRKENAILKRELVNFKMTTQ